MLRWTTTLASIATVAAFVTVLPISQAGEPKKDKDGWIELFNGKDFTGWKIPNPPSGQFTKVEPTKVDGKVVKWTGTLKDGKEVVLWKVEDGMIVGGGPSTHIFTDTTATDFHFRVEAKINDKGNSGQYFRTKFEPGFPSGYEAQINATHSDPIRSGSLYPDARTQLTKHRDEICIMNDSPIKPNKFFTQEVIAEGNHIIIIVNGKKMLDWIDTDNTYMKGHFALQGHDPGSIMTFRKVEYMPITK